MGGHSLDTKTSAQTGGLQPRQEALLPDGSQLRREALRSNRRPTVQAGGPPSRQEAPVQMGGPSPDFRPQPRREAQSRQEALLPDGRPSQDGRPQSRRQTPAQIGGPSAQVGGPLFRREAPSQDGRPRSRQEALLPDGRPSPDGRPQLRWEAQPRKNPDWRSLHLDGRPLSPHSRLNVQT